MALVELGSYFAAQADLKTPRLKQSSRIGLLNCWEYRCELPRQAELSLWLLVCNCSNCSKIDKFYITRFGYIKNKSWVRKAKAVQQTGSESEASRPRAASRGGAAVRGRASPGLPGETRGGPATRLARGPEDKAWRGKPEERGARGRCSGSLLRRAAPGTVPPPAPPGSAPQESPLCALLLLAKPALTPWFRLGLPGPRASLTVLGVHREVPATLLLRSAAGPAPRSLPQSKVGPMPPRWAAPRLSCAACAAVTGSWEGPAAMQSAEKPRCSSAPTRASLLPESSPWELRELLLL